MGVVSKNTSVIGVDVGGTKIYAARFAADNSLEQEATFPANAAQGQEAVLRNLEKAIAKTLDESVAGIGVSWAGFVDSKNGIIRNTPNIGGFQDFPLCDVLQKKFSVPVCIENDARLFTLAEAKVGSAKDEENVIGVILGTGVGSGIVINGQMYSGSSGFAGEIGHSFFSLERYEELEDFLPGPALQQSLQKAGGTGRLADYIDDWKKNKGIGAKVYSDWIERLSRFTINLLLIYNPNVVVFGGGVGVNILPYFLEDLREKVNTFFEQKKYPLVYRLCISDLKNAGALGAAIYERENISCFPKKKSA